MPVALPETTGRRRRRRNIDASECEPAGCAHGGRCLRVGTVRACACAGAWGGARCTLYLGHDHACRARTCPQPALCVWGPDVSATEAGEVRCVCPVGEVCAHAGPGSWPARGPPGRGVPGGGDGTEWAAVVVAAVVVVLVALYLLYKRRRNAFGHALLLSDNVEINNPMYLAGDEEPEPRHRPAHPAHPAHPTHAAHAAHPAHVAAHHNGSRQFANPVYEELYPPEPQRAEEHAILLREGEGEGEGSPPGAERAALL